MQQSCKPDHFLRGGDYQLKHQSIRTTLSKKTWLIANAQIHVRLNLYSYSYSYRGLSLCDQDFLIYRKSPFMCRWVIVEIHGKSVSESEEFSKETARDAFLLMTDQ